jgi:hypothetical protein
VIDNILLSSSAIISPNILPLQGRLAATPGSSDYQAYYDPNLDVTWAASAGQSDPGTWSSIQAWVDDLTIAGIGGWRLPKADANGDGAIVNCANASLAECLDNEMGFLYWQEAVSQSNQRVFSDIFSAQYWSETSSTTSPGTLAWMFQFTDGGQGEANKSGSRYGWAIYPGDVANATAQCDLNNNGKIDAGDLSQVIRMALGTRPENLECDLDNGGAGNGSISVTDVTVVTKMALGLISPIIN